MPSPHTHFYTLSVENPRTQEREAALGPTIGVLVTRAVVPGSVAREQMVVHAATNRVEIYDFHRWAEPLQEAITRVVAGNLAGELGPRYIVSAATVAGGQADIRVSLDVQRLESKLGGNATVEVLWSIRRIKERPRTGLSKIEERNDTAAHSGIAAAYSRALAQIAREIATAVMVATSTSGIKGHE